MADTRNEIIAHEVNTPPWRAAAGRSVRHSSLSHHTRSLYRAPIFFAVIERF